MGDILADAVRSALDAVATALPSLSYEMTAGDVTASVVLSSSINHGVEADTSAQSRRVIAHASDFGTFERWQTVTLGDTRHMIAALRLSGNAAWTLELSKALEPVAFSGTRTSGAMNTTVDALVTEQTFDDPLMGVDADGGLSLWTVRVGCNLFDGTAPRIGDTVTLGDATVLRVRGVAVDGLTYAVTCRGARQ